MAEDIKVIPSLIFIPPRRIVRMGNRWIIYLPLEYGEIWENVRKNNKKIKAYIVIVDEHS
ncbi:MAG: hypothetical protein GXO43_01810 [Crenarchaeota archaeon]|nr:hypothetical protein [Thermoproteota archaeon]